GDRVLLRTPAGEISARAAVIAAGGWCAGLLARTVSRVPRLTVTLQQIRYFPPRCAADDWPALIDWSAAAAQWYAVPAAGGAPGGPGPGASRRRALARGGTGGSGAGTGTARRRSARRAAAPSRRRAGR